MPVRLRLKELIDDLNAARPADDQITYQWLADQAGLSVGVIRRYVYGINEGRKRADGTYEPLQNVSLDSIDRICLVLGVEPGDLFARIPDPTPHRAPQPKKWRKRKKPTPAPDPQQ